VLFSIWPHIISTHQQQLLFFFAEKILALFPIYLPSFGILYL